MKSLIALIALLFPSSDAVPAAPSCVRANSINAAQVKEQIDDSELSITASFSDKQSVQPSEPIELLLSRRLKESEERLAVLIDNTDVSSLFKLMQLRFSYDAKLWPLPLGESTVTVYLVSKADEWKELARFTLVVQESTTSRKRSSLSAQNNFEARFIKANYFDGFASMLAPVLRVTERTAGQDPTEPSSKPSGRKGITNFLPAMTFTLKTRPAQSVFPPSEIPGFADVSMSGTLNNEAKHGSFGSQLNADFAGSSYQQEALRFEDLGNRAPNVDLSSYLFQFQTGPVKYQVGHISYGSHRHLVNSFSSRGITITVPFLKRFDFAAAAMSGTQLLGYNNFFGLSERKHQLFGGTLGVDIFPKRPGGLRLEVGVSAAHFEPLNGVNRGVIKNEERIRGFTLRLIAKDKDERFHFEAGFTRSFSVYPSEDETLAEEPGLASNAHYVNASYHILKDFALSKTRKANLTLGFSEESVAPLFLSPGATIEADKISYGVSMNGSVDEITGEFSYVSSRGNLRNVPSIIKKLGGVSNVSFAAPAKALLGRTKDSPWLPRLAYSFSRNNSFDVAIPVDGGFEVELESIDNLVLRNHTFTADWQIRKFTVGYEFEREFTDNRATGRELTDEADIVNAAEIGIAVNSNLNINLKFSVESIANRKSGDIDRTYWWAPGITWEITKRMEVKGSFSNTLDSFMTTTSRERKTQFDASWIYRFRAGSEGLKKLSGTFNITYSKGQNHLLKRLLNANTFTKDHALTANLSFTLFQ